jgi:hypothetical protein
VQKRLLALSSPNYLLQIVYVKELLYEKKNHPAADDSFIIYTLRKYKIPARNEFDVAASFRNKI